MKNAPGAGMQIHLSKMVWERIDIGVETGFMNFSGINENPSSINYLTLSGKFNTDNKHFLPYPIKYNTDVIDLLIFTKYNFINFSSYSRSFIKLNLFLRLGMGFAYISSKMGYEEKSNYQLSGLTDPLFSSTRDLDFFNRFQGIVNTAVGIHYQISERIFISAEMSFQIFNTGLVDSIYNLNNKLSPDILEPIPDEFKIAVFDFTGKFMIGCTYFFNFDKQRQTRNNIYPWYFNRYRSYYSKYHAPASKRRIKERLPFYYNNFDE